jgi:hypothetical protein
MRPSSRFKCGFAVGADGLAYSGVWIVFTAKRQPDLFIVNRHLSREVKATVHCPRPPRYPGFERHFGFVTEASGAVADAVREESGRHMVRWSGCQLDPSYTLEYRVRIRGISLSDSGTPVSSDVSLLPIPTELEAVDVGVLLGSPTVGTPKEIGGQTHLLADGQLSDGRRVWVIYCLRQIRQPGEPLPPSKLITPKKGYFDPSADLNTNTLRAVLFGAQEDGCLGFLDCKVTNLSVAGDTSSANLSNG